MTAHDFVPKAAHPKSFRFSTALESLGGRAALLRGGDGKLEFRVASPPEFRGEPHVWSPEHLLVAAVDTCLLLTFAGLAEKQKLQVVSYRSEAEGLLEWVEGGFRFTSITLRPQITVLDDRAAVAASELLSRAHATCLVANSLRGDVVVEPTIRTP